MGRATPFAVYLCCLSLNELKQHFFLLNICVLTQGMRTVCGISILNFHAKMGVLGSNSIKRKKLLHGQFIVKQLLLFSEYF